MSTITADREGWIAGLKSNPYNPNTNLKHCGDNKQTHPTASKQTLYNYKERCLQVNT